MLILKHNLAPGYEQKAPGQQEALQGGLTVGKLDAVDGEDGLAVGEDEGVECEDFEHLQSGNQRAPSLLDYVAHCNDLLIVKYLTSRLCQVIYQISVNIAIKILNKEDY